MKVKDIMSKEVFTAQPDMNISEVAKILAENKIHGVPVVDADKKIVGIITETNFFAKVNGEPVLSQFVENVKENKLPDVGDLKVGDEINAETKVKEIMTKDCVTISPEMETEELFEVFRKRGFHTIPVADAEGILCGIVSVADLIAMSAKKDYTKED